ncbi:MAG: Uma2 family endonuclease [Candidatus Eremiobacterota bacterium]
MLEPMTLLDRPPLSTDRLVIQASWEEYTRFLEAVGERRIRLTCDRGTLELVTPSPLHERRKSLLGLLVEAAMEELEIDYVHGGSTTFRREQLDRGMEPDECYWIANYERVRDCLDIDLDVHPPPDLAIEVEVTPASWTAWESTRPSAFPKCGA